MRKLKAVTRNAGDLLPCRPTHRSLSRNKDRHPGYDQHRLPVAARSPGLDAGLRARGQGWAGVLGWPDERSRTLGTRHLLRSLGR